MGMFSRKQKPKPTARIWSAWGDWFWLDTESRHYSQRQDTEGNIETRWGPVYDSPPKPHRRHADREDADDNAEVVEDDIVAAGYSRGTSAPYAGETSEQAEQDSRPPEASNFADSRSRGRGGHKRSSKSHQKKGEDDDYQLQWKKHSRAHERAYEEQHSSRASLRVGDWGGREARSSEQSRSVPSERSGEPDGAEHGAADELVGVGGGFDNDPPYSHSYDLLPEDFYHGHSYSHMDERYYQGYDPDDEQPNLRFQLQGGTYDGRDQGQNSGSCPPEDEESDAPYRSGKEKSRSKGKERAQPSAPAYKTTGGGNGDHRAETPRRYLESGSSEDEDPSEQGKSRSKGNGQAQGRHPGSHSRRRNKVSDRGDDGKLHRGIGKNRGREGERGQNDRDTKV